MAKTRVVRTGEVSWAHISRKRITSLSISTSFHSSLLGRELAVSYLRKPSNSLHQIVRGASINRTRGKRVVWITRTYNSGTLFSPLVIWGVCSICSMSFDERGVRTGEHTNECTADTCTFYILPFRSLVCCYSTSGGQQSRRGEFKLILSSTRV